MTNKYFEKAKPVKFDYFKKFPERRRLAIVSDKSYRIYDQKAFNERLYDAGKLNSFIKVINDKLWIDSTSFSKKIIHLTNSGHVVERFPFNQSENVFKKIFLIGDFLSIEVFKYLITLGIQSKGIDKIIFSAMPADLSEETYIQNVPGSRFFKSPNGDFSVVVAIEEKVIYVAMWQHLFEYE